MVGARGERRAHLRLDTVVARRAFAGGKQAVAEHSRWIQVMRARVDVHGAGAHDELGGLVELRGVEQLLRFGQSGLVEPLHAFHHLRRGGGDIEGKVDVHVAPVARLGRQTDEFDFEVFESLEAEFFCKSGARS